MTIGAELTRFGAKVHGQFLRVVDVAACVARTWRELAAVDLGVKIHGAELGANYYSAELWKLINFNFYHDLNMEKCG